MKNIIERKKQLPITLNAKGIFFDCISFAFVILFVYTASSKFIAFSEFSGSLGKLPLVGNYALVLAYAIPISEILVSLLLIIPVTKRWGMAAAVLLMSVFSIFLVYMVATVEYLPCSCGGVIARMTWEQHIVFNAAFLAAGIIGLSISRK